MHRERWARVLALVLAFLLLFINIPFGTAVGVYTMWVLLPGESSKSMKTWSTRAPRNGMDLSDFSSIDGLL